MSVNVAVIYAGDLATVAEARSSARSPAHSAGAETFSDCFREYADLLSWDVYRHTILDTSEPPFWRWFAGGRLNACYNCVDRHLAARAQPGGADLGARA